jgi:hypothetical protein
LLRLCLLLLLLGLSGLLLGGCLRLVLRQHLLQKYWIRALQAKQSAGRSTSTAENRTHNTIK